MRTKERNKRTTGFVLTARDTALLELVSVNRYASTAQVARGLFPSEDRARRRIRRLYEAGLVNIVLLSSTEPNLIVLTKAGMELLHELRPDLAGGVHLPGPIRLAGVRHHLALVDAHLYLREVARAERGRLLRFGSGRSSLAQEFGFTGHLVPDAVAEMEVQGQTVRLAIEADCGTEGTKTLQAKLATYGSVFAEGKVDELWIVVIGSEAHAERVAEVVQTAGLSEQTRVMTQDLINQRPVQKPGPRVAGWRRGRAPSESASSSLLLPLSSSGVTQAYPVGDGRADGGADG